MNAPINEMGKGYALEIPADADGVRKEKLWFVTPDGKVYESKTRRYTVSFGLSDDVWFPVEALDRRAEFIGNYAYPPTLFS